MYLWRPSFLKMLEFFESGERQLYDLSEVSEEMDRSGQEPQKVDELHERLVRWREERKMPMPTRP